MRNIITIYLRAKNKRKRLNEQKFLKEYKPILLKFLCIKIYTKQHLPTELIKNFDIHLNISLK